MLKVIVKYSKTGYSKYLGHLEMVTQIERILRRLVLPLEYSKGFNPKPQIAFAAPLSVGVSSVGEYFEFKVLEKFDLDKITNIDTTFLPVGIEFLEAEIVETKESIMALVKGAEYVLKVKTIESHKEDDVRVKLNEFLALDEVMWTKIRKKKKPITKNIVELINKIYILNTSNNELIFRVDVKTGSDGNLKPDVAIEKFLEYAKIELKEKHIAVQRIDIKKKVNDKLVTII